jgi:hypothetical protein
MKERKTKMKKTDREILLQILKKAGVKICYEEKDYFEAEPSTYGENIGFQFDADGKLQKLL